MERRDFIKILPITVLPSHITKDGIARYELPDKGHFVFVMDVNKVLLGEIDNMASNPHILPPGASGGAIIIVDGDPEEALKIYQLNKDA